MAVCVIFSSWFGHGRSVPVTPLRGHLHATAVGVLCLYHGILVRLLMKSLASPDCVKRLVFLSVFISFEDSGLAVLRVTRRVNQHLHFKPKERKGNEGWRAVIQGWRRKSGIQRDRRFSASSPDNSSGDIHTTACEQLDVGRLAAFPPWHQPLSTMTR